MKEDKGVMIGNHDQIHKKIIFSKSYGSVVVIWSFFEGLPKIVRILMSCSRNFAEKRASILFPDSKEISCMEIDKIAGLIHAFLEGEDIKFSLSLVDISLFTKFQQSVLQAQYAVPRGSVTTYHLLAAYVGVPGAARAVGNVMAANPFPLIIPCHRTVRSDLRPGGFQSGVEMKKGLLEREGIVFDDTGKVKCPSLYYAF
jgi:methylated-DNA-[protein]-cysteine S-methyltransferase